MLTFLPFPVELAKLVSVFPLWLAIFQSFGGLLSFALSQYRNKFLCVNAFHILYAIVSV